MQEESPQVTKSALKQRVCAEVWSDIVSCAHLQSIAQPSVLHCELVVKEACRLTQHDWLLATLSAVRKKLPAAITNGFYLALTSVVPYQKGVAASKYGAPMY